MKTKMVSLLEKLGGEEKMVENGTLKMNVTRDKIVTKETVDSKDDKEEERTVKLSNGNVEITLRGSPEVLNYFYRAKEFLIEAKTPQQVLV